MIELLEYFSDTLHSDFSMFGLGLAHIALTVSNVDKLYDELQAAGIKFLSTPQISPDEYAKVVFCKAPEGSYIELVEVL